MRCDEGDGGGGGGGGKVMISGEREREREWGEWEKRDGGCCLESVSIGNHHNQHHTHPSTCECLRLLFFLLYLGDSQWQEKPRQPRSVPQGQSGGVGSTRDRESTREKQSRPGSLLPHSHYHHSCSIQRRAVHHWLSLRWKPTGRGLFQATRGTT